MTSLEKRIGLPRSGPGEASARQEFAGMLKKAGLTMDDVPAEACASEIDSLERFDREHASAEARRNNAYARLIVTAQHSAAQCGK